MPVMLLGVNHKTCPVEIREKFHFSEDEEKLLLDTSCNLVEEIIILSTCNRREIYFVTGKDYKKEKILEYFFKEKIENTEEVLSHLYFMTDGDAVEHLFSVASGIDSMIVGEGQILGQTKEALKKATERETTDTILCQLFRSAILCGKRARTETKIGTGASSVSYAAVEFAKMLYGNLTGRTVMIIGAGKMAHLTGKILNQYGLKQVIVANRNYERAISMAEQFNGEAIHFDRLDEYLIKSDIVISSTSAPHYILHYDNIKKVMYLRKNRPLFLIDIAVPRDIDPLINKLTNVFLYDIDDLKEVVEKNLEERKDEIEKVKKIIYEEKNKFISWYRTREVVPIIKSIKNQAETIRLMEMSKVFKKLGTLTEDELNVIDCGTKRIVNKLLHNTIIKLKEISSNGRTSANPYEIVSELFNVEQEEEKWKD